MLPASEINLMFELGLFNFAESLYGVQIGLTNEIGEYKTKTYHFVPLINARFKD